MGRKKNRIIIDEGVTISIPQPRKKFFESIEYKAWREAMFQYIIDHARIDYNGRITAIFVINDKHDLISRMRGRMHGYKRTDWEKMYEESKEAQKEYKAMRKKRVKRRKNLPSWLKPIDIRFRRFSIKQASRIRKFLWNVILYLE